MRSGGAKASIASDESNKGSMVWVPGGSFLMGSNAFYREERPLRRETVQGFWMDVHPVTNAEFRKFVAATGYVTACEREPDPAMYPDADPSLLVPGSSVFRQPGGPVDLRDNRAWWEYVPGADWRHPEGPDSSIAGRDDHPVVHVTYEESSRPAAASRARLTRGARRLLRRGGQWPTPGRAHSPGRISSSTDTRAPLPSMLFPRMGMASTT